MSRQANKKVADVDQTSLGLDDLVPQEDDDDDHGTESLYKMKPHERQESLLADRLSVRLLQIDDDDEETENQILRQSLNLLVATEPSQRTRSKSSTSLLLSRRGSRASMLMDFQEEEAFIEGAKEQAHYTIKWMLFLACLGILAAVGVAFYTAVKFVGPPNQPVGPYILVERQEGSQLFDYYSFYDGKDSAGSAGFNTYASFQRAQELGIINVSMEEDLVYTSVDDEIPRRLKRHADGIDDKFEPIIKSPPANETSRDGVDAPFVYIRSAPTEEGPRESVRLEGIRRFNRGLFIIDVRHMPAGCGQWPAFWLTDEANWPVNGEIDIVEGVNYQDKAKTALHATSGCDMYDIPLGTMTGTWDTAQGIPDAKTGIPDLTMRYAKDCFAYDPHQWLNQGCVATDRENGTLGVPLNDKGGGVFALEWDPINRHIRSWAFTPHSSVPYNLAESIRTASFAGNLRVAPNPESWPIPYGYFAIGEGTDCEAHHFRNMRLVINTAFCGSVAGNRFQLDCKEQAKQFETCNDWLMSEPDELQEAYWKIRGVYVYQRQWERTWIH